MATGFFATVNSEFVNAYHTHIPFSVTATAGGWNSGMLDTSTGIATVPESGVYHIDASVNLENNAFRSGSYIVDVIVEINGNTSRLRSQQTITNNDANTVQVSGTLSLVQGTQVRIKLSVSQLQEDMIMYSGFFGTYFSMIKQ